MSLPVVDLADFISGDSDGKTKVANQVDQACQDVGFFSIVGHGVDDRVIENAHSAALAFFDLDLTDRMLAAKPYSAYPYGYAPFSAEALERSLGGQGVPDLKETYNVGPLGSPPKPLEQMTDPDERDVWADTPWPDAMPTLRSALNDYYVAMAELAATVMDVFAHALKLGADWFEPLINEHGSALRLAHYPALDAAPGPGELRAGAHSDYGTLTILRLDAEPGLQVQNGDGSWADVEAPDGAFVVNLGDLMQRWTNDRWRSTVHRVVVPDGRHDQRRLTMPFFHNANWDATVACIVSDGDEPRYEPVLAGAHLMAKFRSTVL